jgi:hypothetical protein
MRRALIADGDLARIGERSAASLDEKVWLDESRKFATDYTYKPLLPYLQELEKDGGELLPITLTEDYLKTVEVTATCAHRFQKLRTAQAPLTLGR